MPIWVYPLLVVIAGLLLAFIALHRKGQALAMVFSLALMILGISAWAGIKRAHCPSDGGSSVAAIDEMGVTCGSVSGCCVELLPVDTSTCILLEQSGPAQVGKTVSHHYLSANDGVTAVAACVEWRPWKAW